MRYWFPYPLLSISLLIFWLLMNQSVAPAQILLGSILGISLGWVMVNLQPERVKIKKPMMLIRLLLHVAWDIVKSNLAVLTVILRSGRHPATSGFLYIDITLKDENALAVLACILTSTPGTAWLEFDKQRGVLLLHVLDIENENNWNDLIKNRYERPLKEIFE